MTGGELIRSEVAEIKPASVENYKNIKPEKDMSPKELNEAINSEFGKVAKDYYDQKFDDSNEKSGKELTPQQIKDLISNGMSPNVIKDCRYDDGIYKLKTQNENFADNKHPDTGVSYVRKVIDVFGNKIEGVFAKFDAVFTVDLPADKLLTSDKIQFDYCNEQLKNALKDNPSLMDKFTTRQIDQISNGQKPSGFSWNHNEEVGKMELVKTEEHANTPHTGGKAIWGGGRDFR